MKVFEGVGLAVSRQTVEFGRRTGQTSQKGALFSKSAPKNPNQIRISLHYIDELNRAGKWGQLTVS